MIEESEGTEGPKQFLKGHPAPCGFKKEYNLRPADNVALIWEIITYISKAPMAYSFLRFNTANLTFIGH